MLKPFLFLLLSFACFIEGKFLTTIEHDADGGVRAYAYRDTAGKENGELLCALYYNNTYLDLGWDTIELQTNPVRQTDLEQVQCAGQLEGLVSTDAIYKHYFNNIKQWCKGRKRTCIKVYKFIGKHFRWIKKSIKRHGKHDSTWHHVNMFYSQIIAMQQAYMIAQNDSRKALTVTDFIMMNLQWDLDDLAEALEGDVGAKVRGNSHCSAIIKLLPDNEDLLVGHNTWMQYTQMYRMIKKYEIPLHTRYGSNRIIPATLISFSGYPGVITSEDDFYVANSGLVATETTIGNNDAKRWSHVKPTGQLFESVRSLIALRLSENGHSWCKTFSGHNSGTYNNEWMIVDFNKYKKGKQPEAGTLWILEQIPGYIRFEDQTPVLLQQTYWPSYNVPFYQDVFNMSGNQQLVDEYGDWFSYNNTPRARIFRRDHSNVKDLQSLMTLLRSNNYKHDEYSRCNCTPPYSADNALSSRSDLNPKNGKYPFPALGHLPHGAIDAKVISSLLVKNQTFVAICGPSTGNKLPAFRWDKSDFKHLPHMGQPNSFVKFHPFIPDWQGPFL